MGRLIIAAPHSGAGKTTICLGLLAALSRLGVARDAAFCFFHHDNFERQRHAGAEAACAAWYTPQEWLTGEAFDLVIFDEITYAVNYGFVALDEVVTALQNRRADLHVILTGRAAPPELIAVADLVTDMRLIKHPYGEGVRAQKGVEF